MRTLTLTLITCVVVKRMKQINLCLFFFLEVFDSSFFSFEVNFSINADLNLYKNNILKISHS